MINGFDDFRSEENTEEFKKMHDKVNSIMHNNDPCTPRQRGHIYGLCKKLGYDPRELPSEVSPKPETRDLTLGEAREVLEILLGNKNARGEEDCII